MSVYKRDSRGNIVKRGEGTWWIDFTIDGKRYKKALRGIKTKAEAERIESHKRLEVYEGRYGKEREAITFDDFVNKVYLPHAKNSIKSFYYYERFAGIFCRYFKAKSLNEITAADIEAFRQYRRDNPTRTGAGRKLATINREVMQLSSIFKLAVDLGYCESNPARKIKPYKTHNRRTRVLLPEEERRLLEAMTGTLAKYRPIILLLLHTGMRLGEVVGLRWDYVDLSKGVIILPAGTTKNDKSRTLPLNDEAMKTLSELLTQSQGKGRVFAGRGFTGQHASKLIASVCDRIGLPDVTAHTLRHTFATRLMERNLNPLHVKELLGHATLRMTDHYTHIGLEALRQSVNILNHRADDRG